MPDHIYVYPAYLAKERTQAAGRRVAKEIAVPEVTLEAIVSAAKHLGYSAEPQPEKNYPRRFFEYAGRVKITKKAGVSKTRLLRLLAEEMVRHPFQGGPG
jgi:signal recognition particle subunit SRP19